MRHVLLVQPNRPGPTKWLSMSRYAAGLALALEPDHSVQTIAATSINMPQPLRSLFGRYRNLERLPRRWPSPPGIVHFTDVFLAPHAGRFACPRVTTLHDMIPMLDSRVRQVVSPQWRVEFLRSLNSLRNSDAIIVPSQATKRAYLARRDDNPDRLHVVPVVVPEDIAPPPAWFEREPRTVLVIGTIAPYKNVPVLLHALARPELVDAKVVRVGEPFPRQYQQLAERLGVASRIEHRSGVSNEELLSLFHRATVLAQPSLTEGFGMPVAEAMAAGLPVVTSDGGALPEVAGTAGRVVPFRTHREGPPDLDDARAFATALAEVLDDAASRERMSRDGITQAARFRPAAVRPLLLAAYADARERSGR